jgi:hypothetical protein
VDHLHQLRARSRHEIEAHAGALDRSDTGLYFIDEATELLAALRLWAESQFRTDQAIRLLLEAANAGALDGVARELLELGTPEEQTAGRTIVDIAGRPSGELMAVAAYALRAL